jgi:hypothetical protein
MGLAELLLVFRPNVGDETPFPAVTRNAVRGFVEPAWALRHPGHLPPDHPEHMFACWMSSRKPPSRYQSLCERKGLRSREVTLKPLRCNGAGQLALSAVAAGQATGAVASRPVRRILTEWPPDLRQRASTSAVGRILAASRPRTVSMASRVRSSESGQRCEYVSSVSAADACPSRACTTFTLSP